uniref:C-type lectin domain-containing protein n=1 Tax=Plectus sambesii TaxID=2011161 RepID=A0A914X0V7_9BILA
MKHQHLFFCVFLSLHLTSIQVESQGNGCPTGFQKPNDPGDKCFIILDITSPASQSDVVSACDNQSAIYGSVQSAAQLNEIIGLFPGLDQTNKIYTGLELVGATWLWSDGSPATYVSWPEAEPTDPDYPCSKLVYNTTLSEWQWNAIDCGSSFCCNKALCGTIPCFHGNLSTVTGAVECQCNPGYTGIDCNQTGNVLRQK